MKKFNKRTIYIVLFAILYICVGLVSTIHAVSFFALANVMALAVILALSFEIGQAAVLFSILTDIRKRKKVMPWLLMGVLTIVQIMGNIYSSYKYLMTNSTDSLRYFKEPIFVWTTIPDQNANVLLVYIIGAILPIVSLLMTAMLTSYLEKDEQIEEEIEELEETEEEKEIEDDRDDEEEKEYVIEPEEESEPEVIEEDEEEQEQSTENNQKLIDMVNNEDQKFIEVPVEEFQNNLNSHTINL